MSKIIKPLQHVTDKRRDFSRRAFKAFWGPPSSLTSQAALVLKNQPANPRDLRHTGLIPGSGSSPRGGHGNPLQYSCLETPMDEIA